MKQTTEKRLPRALLQNNCFEKSEILKEHW